MVLIIYLFLGTWRHVLVMVLALPTTLILIFGFIPLALNLEEGGEMLQPMAAGGIGGLALGILVALFMMPCLYVVFAQKRQG